MSCDDPRILSAAFSKDIHLWIQPRPWLALYGRHIGKPKQSQVPLAPIQHLPDEIMRTIFHKLPPASVARAGAVCRQWRHYSQCPSIWQKFCMSAFSTIEHEKNLQLLRLHYSNSWQKMYVERPHLRFDGVYVSRNTYFRMGAAILSIRNPVHLVVFYRYYRFFSDGTLLTRTSPLPVSKVWPSLARMPYYLEHSDSRLPGKWKLKGANVYTACLYPGQADAEMRSKLRLRTCMPGLNNRLDVEEIFTYDRGQGSRINLDDPAADDEDQEKMMSNRGTNTLVFVHQSEVNTHIINLPKDKMDFWIPG